MTGLDILIDMSDYAKSTFERNPAPGRAGVLKLVIVNIRNAFGARRVDSGSEEDLLALQHHGPRGSPLFGERDVERTLVRDGVPKVFIRSVGRRCNLPLKRV